MGLTSRTLECLISVAVITTISGTKKKDALFMYVNGKLFTLVQLKRELQGCFWYMCVERFSFSL